MRHFINGLSVVLLVIVAITLKARQDKQAVLLAQQSNVLRQQAHEIAQLEKAQAEIVSGCLHLALGGSALTQRVSLLEARRR